MKVRQTITRHRSKAWTVAVQQIYEVLTLRGGEEQTMQVIRIASRQHVFFVLPGVGFGASMPMSYGPFD